MWTIPNLMTLSRLLLLIPICFLMTGGWAMHALAFVLYVLAAVTDYVDGWWARTFNEQSDLGRMMDPIVDKIFVATLFLMLTVNGTFSGMILICPIIILGREFLVAGLREYLGPRGGVIPVSKLAKWKTTVQMTAIGLLIFPGMAGLGYLLLVIATFLTVITAVQYIRAAGVYFNTP